MTFIGCYYHALEQKGRLSIPVLFRKNLGEAAIITAGLDGCLFLFPQSTWSHQLNQAKSASITKKNQRDWVRYLTNNAEQVECDAQGRILIPEHLRKQANLHKHTVIVGSLDRLEIWDQTRFHTYLEATSKSIESIVETLEVNPEKTV